MAKPSGSGTVWAMWASGPPTFWTVYFWHYFLLFLFCLSPLIIDSFQDWPTHFQNRSAAAGEAEGGDEKYGYEDEVMNIKIYEEQWKQEEKLA